MSTICVSNSPSPLRVQSKRWIMWGPRIAGYFPGAGHLLAEHPARSTPARLLNPRGKFYSLAPVDLDVKVKKDGELQSRQQHRDRLPG